MVAYTTPDCTDQVSSCDHQVGAFFKTVMSTCFNEQFASNRDRWQLTASEGGLASERMKMASWAAIAWEVLKRKPDLLRSAFVSTGFLIAKNGSEMNLIKLAGLENYDFTQ